MRVFFGKNFLNFHNIPTLFASILIWGLKFKYKRQREVSRFLKTLKSITPKRKLTFEKIIEGIRNESLYGFLIVDIHTPNELKEKFKDFPLIIKNSFISRKDIGDYMQNVAEEHNLLKKEQKYLISSTLQKNF